MDSSKYRTLSMSPRCPLFRGFTHLSQSLSSYGITFSSNTESVALENKMEGKTSRLRTMKLPTLSQRGPSLQRLSPGLIPMARAPVWMRQKLHLPLIPLRPSTSAPTETNGLNFLLTTYFFDNYIHYKFCNELKQPCKLLLGQW